MRLALDELANRLVKQDVHNLPKIILINGSELLLIEEALDAIREGLKSIGFTERINHQLAPSFDWHAITGVGQAMSLFAERRIIELRVPNKLGVAGTKALTEYCGNPPQDDILVVVMPALDKRQRQAKWAKVIESTGWVADCYGISAQQFPHWLKQRLQSRSLRVETGVVDVLAEKLEGNVLAAAQEIDKLQVLADNGAVTLKLLSESLADQARFDVYTFTDVCLNGDFPRALRIKQRLQSEGIEPVIVVWSLVREIRLLAMLAGNIAAGQNRAMLFKQHRVWSKRETLVNAALNRLNLTQWHHLLERAAYLDQTVKGQRPQAVGSLWYQLELLCGELCGVKAVPAALYA
jgi:DNA polymerase-3 subunit delta